MRNLVLIFIFIQIFAVLAPAAELYEINRSVRALGMGNAYTAVVDNEDSLFYNPAGIAKNSGIFWTIVDPGIGLNGIDAYDAFSDLSSSGGFASGLNSLYGNPIWVGVNAKTAVITPYFAAAYFDSLDLGVKVNNPTATELTVDIVNDMGIALGTGFSFGVLQFGGVVKRIDRTGARRTYGPSTIAGIIDGSTDVGVIFDNYSNSGIGYALDLGFNLKFPTMISPTMSLVWKNVGDTSFSTSSPAIEAPPTEKQEMILGAGMDIGLPLMSITPSIDIKHLQDTDIQLGKKIHMGVELGLPLFDLRAGFHQGYLSYGVGVNLGLLQIDAASWGVELGEYPGQIEDRRYMVQLSIKIGFDFGFGSSASGSTGSNGSGRSGASGSAFSRVKRRR